MKKVAIIVLDGFGVNTLTEHENAIARSEAPTIRSLFASPHAELDASGLAVGIPEGQMGNSEVGHMTIGAGRAIPQGIVRIDQSLDSGAFARLPEFAESIAHVRSTGARLHLVGLFGNGGVHASHAHLVKILHAIPSDIAVRLHLFTDGRDLPPRSALGLWRDFEKILAAKPNVRVATIGGRYYGMDRDDNWDRVERAYAAMTGAIPSADATVAETIERAYAADVTDEFIAPTLFSDEDAIRAGDAVWHLNFRSDRARELTQAFADTEFSGFSRALAPDDVRFVAMTPSYEKYAGAAFFRDGPIADTLGQIIAEAGLTQLRTAETEKFAHVTKFFNGGRFEPFAGETDRLVASHKVATYDLDPDMSADEIFAIFATESQNHALTVVNYANGDMVGHTGDLPAAIRAVEALDRVLAASVEHARAHGIDLLITADHGNCEEMGTPDAPKTSHTTNLVPFWHIRDGVALPTSHTPGTLADVAPTALALLGLPQPAAMTGRSLAA